MALVMTTSPSSEAFTKGRIRLNEQEAILLLDMLARDIDRMLDARLELIEAGVEDGKALYNAKIAMARRIEAEIERTAHEKGWAEAIEVLASSTGDA